MVYKLDQNNRRKFYSMYYLTPNKMKSHDDEKSESLEMRETVKRNFCLQWPSTRSGLNWDFARGVMNCLPPFNILHANSLLSQQTESFLSTTNQTIVHLVSFELQRIGIENFKILSALFSYLHFAFHRRLGNEDSTTSATVFVAQKATFSPYQSTQLSGHVDKLVFFRTMTVTYVQAKMLLCTSIHTPREELFELARSFQDTSEVLYIKEHLMAVCDGGRTGP